MTHMEHLAVHGWPRRGLGFRGIFGQQGVYIHIYICIEAGKGYLRIIKNKMETEWGCSLQT